MGRPTITVIIDKYSRMIVGMHVGFDPPGYLSVMLCLLNAITPKGYVETDFPNVENKWNTYGIPEQIVVDNAPEFYSEDFDDSCRRLGILPLYSPVKHPWFKASVERFFGTQNRRLLHNQPGTTFSNIIARGDYNPKKEPLKVDTVHSTLLAVTHLPQVVFAAETDYLQSEHEEVKKLVKYPENKNELTPFVLREKLLAFHDLSDKDGPFAGIVNTTKVERLRSTEMWADAEGKRRYVNLLNRSLYKHTGRLGVRYDPEHYRFYFPVL